MDTRPCPKCGRHVMRDGAVGLLVCSCGQVLEFPSDLEGPVRPKDGDLRWFGTEGERQDVHELGLPERPLPTRQSAIEELERRARENEARERTESEEERARSEIYMKELLGRTEGSQDG